MTTTTPLPAELLAEVPTDIADLSRKTSTYEIQVIYLPDIKTPETAQITLKDPDGSARGTLTVPAEQALDVFRHPGAHFDWFLNNCCGCARCRQALAATDAQ